MIHTLSLLTPDEAARAVTVLSSIPEPPNARDYVGWVDGKQTARGPAAAVKQSEVLHVTQRGGHPLEDDPTYNDVWQLQWWLQDKLTNNIELQRRCMPARITTPAFVRYREGAYYGPHVDAAVINGVRTDLSVTVWLSNAINYDGGELLIGDPYDDDVAGGRQPQGWVTVYPSTSIHQVTPIKQGVRLVAIAWIQSRVRNPAHREILYDLGCVERALVEREGKTGEGDLLAKTYCNLMREWVEL